ncbi:MAG: hypothetical protein R3A44_02480 [Caldilineaceae bacterium]
MANSTGAPTDYAPFAPTGRQRELGGDCPGAFAETAVSCFGRTGRRAAHVPLIPPIPPSALPSCWPMRKRPW